MATGQLNGVVHRLRGLALLGDAQRLTDAELLGCFIADNEESAFAGLVERHGSMVFSVCRRILGNSHDAEDAFQAAFLVLARKAATIRPRTMVGNWLYGVAYRTALRAKTMIAKRQSREKQVRDIPECAAPAEPGWNDLKPLIDQELNALADRYRVPVVLCDLEGMSQREAAKQLGWPESTLMTRLARARQMLAKRLSRRGIVLCAAALAVVLAQNGASASASASVAAAISKAAVLVAGGQAATALVSTKVVALTEGVLQTMFLAKIKSAALVLIVVLTLGAGAGWLLQGSQASESPATGPVPLVNPVLHDDGFIAALEQERGDKKADPNSLQGKIVAVAKDGKAFTIETISPPANRGEDAVKGQVVIKIDDKSELKFFGVGLDGAKLAEGMQAQVSTRGGAKDVAAKVQIGSARETRLGVDLSGKVTAISKDGATLTFESGGRGETKTTEIKLTARTMVAYANITKDGNKPTIGYGADVWLERGSKTDAAAISFRGVENLGREPGRAGQTVNGPVVNVGKDGKSFTVEVPSLERGQAAEKLTIKIAENTRVIFNNVGLNGARLTEGLRATITLAEGSKDTAFLVTLAPPQENVRR